MLTKVTLENFQAHKHLELEFGKFTTLTGGSNGGKSAVLRAILALVRNDSPGDYLRHGQKTLTVTLEFSDGSSVAWTKGSGENRYVVTDADGVVSTFDKVGANVPEEVSAVLKLGPVLTGSGDKQYVNFHTQLEQPFLISATPGDVAKLLGELTSASRLYTAVNEGNRSVRSTNSQKTLRMGDLRQVKIDLEEFDDIEAQGQELTEVFQILKAATRASVTEKGLEEARTRLFEVDKQVKELESACNRLAQAEMVSLAKLQELGTAHGSLERTINAYNKAISGIERAKIGTEGLTEAVGVDLSLLSATNGSLSALESAVRRVGLSEGSIAEVSGKLKSLQAEMQADDERRDELMQLVADCPHCGQDLTEEARDTLLSGAVRHATH